jgi:hypothetical protein
MCGFPVARFRASIRGGQIYLAGKVGPAAQFLPLHLCSRSKHPPRCPFHPPTRRFMVRFSSLLGRKPITRKDTVSHHHLAVLLFTICCAVCAEKVGPQTEKSLIPDESIIGKTLLDLHDGKWKSSEQLDGLIYEFYGLKTVVGYRVIIHPGAKLDYKKYLASCSDGIQPEFDGTMHKFTRNGISHTHEEGKDSFGVRYWESTLRLVNIDKKDKGNWLENGYEPLAIKALKWNVDEVSTIASSMRDIRLIDVAVQIKNSKADAFNLRYDMLQYSKLAKPIIAVNQDLKVSYYKKVDKERNASGIVMKGKAHQIIITQFLLGPKQSIVNIYYQKPNAMLEESYFSSRGYTEHASLGEITE